MTAQLKRTGAISYGFGPHGAVRDDDQRTESTFLHTSQNKSKSSTERGTTSYRRVKEGRADTEFSPDVFLATTLFPVPIGQSGLFTPPVIVQIIFLRTSRRSLLIFWRSRDGMGYQRRRTPDGSMKDYMVSLRKLLNFDHEQYWPTHGPAIPNPIAYVQSFVSHEKNARPFLGTSSTGLKRSPTSCRRCTANDKRLWYPAAGSSTPLHMVETGRAEVIDDHGAN